MEPLTKAGRVAGRICRAVVVLILTQTLFFKFSGAEESVYIFSQIGLEPWGRYGAGFAELTAAILLLWPRFIWAGALMSLGIISGALASHLTVLGVVVNNDGGLLFGLAIIVFVASATTAFLYRQQIPCLGHLLKPKPA